MAAVPSSVAFGDTFPPRGRQDQRFAFGEGRYSKSTWGDNLQFYEILLIAVALAMDAFAVSLCKGLAIGKIKIKHLCIVGAWFGGFQALMPILGYLLGSTVRGYVDAYDHWIAFVLLALIGGNMIREGLSKDKDEDENDGKSPLGIVSMLLLAVATSIDAFAVGVTFALEDVNAYFASAVIGIVTFLISAAGVKIGSIFGEKYKSAAEIVGGCILVIIGIKILIEGLM